MNNEYYFEFLRSLYVTINFREKFDKKNIIKVENDIKAEFKRFIFDDHQ